MRVMNKKTIICAMATLMAFSFAACGKNDGNSEATTVEITTEAKTEAETEEATTEDASGKEEEYKSEDGWSVKYNSSTIKVNEIENGASFVYSGESAGSDLISFEYLKGKNSKDTIKEKVAGNEQALNNIQEDYFNNDKDIWYYKTNVSEEGEGSGLSTDYISIEYNGGTLYIQIDTHKESDDEKGMAVSDAISGIIDSLEFDDFQPQKELSYVPGLYKREYKDTVDGKETKIEESVNLNSDHTGVLTFQDKIDVTWTSTKLIENQSGNAYDYSINGTIIKVNLGGKWVEFDKSGKVSTEETTEVTTEATTEDKDKAQKEKEEAEKKAEEEKTKEKDSEAKEAEESTQNPIMNYIGKYVYEKANIEVSALGDDEGEIKVTWANGAAEYNEWTMSGKFNAKNLTIKYKNCVKKSVHTDENGNEEKTEEYTDGEGKIVFTDDGKLLWQDEEEHVAKNVEFTFNN